MTREQFDEAQKLYSKIESVDDEFADIEEIERCFDDKDYKWKYLTFHYINHFADDMDDFRTLHPTVEETRQLISAYKEMLKKRKAQYEKEIEKI